MKDMNNRGTRRHHDFGPQDFETQGFDPQGFGPQGYGPQGFGPRGRRGGFGPPFPPGFAPGPRRGPRGGRPRGDVRSAILLLLAEQPRHGYDLMRAIEERSGGMWSPSPGSIYPTLQALEDEGLITFEAVEGRKTASVTDSGRTWLSEHTAETGAVFAQEAGADQALAIRREVHQLREAVMVATRRGGDTADKATHILANARREIYGLLAGDA